MDMTLQNEVADRGQNGVGSNGVETPPASRAWKTYAGIWRDNPDLEAFWRQIEETRREADEASTEP
jgi:hypothetical protein